MYTLIVFPYTSMHCSSFPFPPPWELLFWEGGGREGTLNLVRCNYCITKASVYTNYRLYRKLKKLIPV